MERELYVGGSSGRKLDNRSWGCGTLQQREQTDERRIRICQSCLFGATHEDFNFDERQDYFQKRDWETSAVCEECMHASGIKER